MGADLFCNLCDIEHRTRTGTVILDVRVLGILRVGEFASCHYEKQGGRFWNR
jgi:hypothetical protein